MAATLTFFWPMFRAKDVFGLRERLIGHDKVHFPLPSHLFPDIINSSILKIFWDTAFYAASLVVAFRGLRYIDRAATSFTTSFDLLHYNAVEGIPGPVKSTRDSPLYISFIVPTALLYSGSTSAVQGLPFYFRMVLLPFRKIWTIYLLCVTVMTVYKRLRVC